MSRLFRRSALASALYLSFSTPAAHAAGPSPAASPDGTVLPEIIVTADPFARPADTLTQPVEVLTGDALDRRRGLTVGETLENELGVSTTDFGRGAGRRAAADRQVRVEFANDRSHALERSRAATPRCRRSARARR